MINEEGLRDWFGKSKSKDGKSGWVNVVTGGTCASDEPGEGTPKCVSSAKRASMSKKERLSAQRRKKAADPGQQQKSGAAKPTYVSTDPKKKMKKEEVEVTEAKDKPGKGSGSKDACYHKVKSRYSVWPSAYASGALVKCRKVGAANWGNSTKKEELEGFYDLPELTEAQIAALKYAGYEVEVLDEKCWPGYEKKGMKTMFGKRYPNCVKKEETEVVEGKYSSSVRATYGGKTETFPKEVYKKKTKKTQTEGVLDAALETDKKMGELHKKVDNDVKRMKAGKKFKEEVTGGILIQDKEDFTPREIESVDIIKPEPIKGGQLQEVVRTKPQTGNMYQVIFGWRGKMMMVKLFFPDAKVPNRQKVASTLDKMYPGSQLRSYSISVVDYDDPYINVGVDEETDYNKDVQTRMDNDEKRQRRNQRYKHMRSRINQHRGLPVNQNEEVVNEDEMKGLSVKSGHKRSVKQGAGLTQKGVDAVNRRTGGNLKTAVTTPPSKLKPGSKAAKRRKSFCARSRGWTGERGKAARRRWNC